MQKRSYYIINSITAYRLLVSPLLIFLIISNNINLFKWMLAISFFTDLVDGVLARKFRIESVFGSRLDSIADDFTILATIIGIFILKPLFVNENLIIIVILLILYVMQNIFSLVKYHKISSFHTYLAKTAAVLQGAFLILLFFLSQPPYILFYPAAIFTILDLLEEIVLVLILPEWKTNVKGIYWVITKKNIT